MSIVNKGLKYVNQIILKQGYYSTTMPAGTTTQTVTIAHNLKKTVFVDFKYSLDNGTTWLPPYTSFTNDTTNNAFLTVTVGADSTNMYFTMDIGSNTAGISLILDYILYVTEASNG